MKTLQIAVVGASARGHYFVKTMAKREDVDLVALVDTMPARAQAVREMEELPESCRISSRTRPRCSAPWSAML